MFEIHNFKILVSSDKKTLILRARKVELFYLQKWHLNRVVKTSRDIDA